MKNNIIKSLSLLSIIGATFLCASCSKDNSSEIEESIRKEQERIEKEISEIRNIQLGRTMSSYFDSLARQPEEKQSLDQAKEKLIQAFEDADTKGKCYALGSLGGSKYGYRYEQSISSGVYDSIARQPSQSEHLITVEEKVITYVLASTNDPSAEMIGIGSASLCDAIARQPEIYEQLFEYSNYINNSINSIDEVEKVYSIGYASISFYDSLARQPENSATTWSEFKTFIDGLK